MSNVEASIQEKIKKVGLPLAQWQVNIYRGILTGYNQAFIIDDGIKEQLIKEDPRSVELIRPILRGRDIQRFAYNYANLWVINVHNGIKELGIPPIDIDDYPAIKAHLDQFYPKLAIRADRGVTPYNLRNCAYLNDFSRQKIIWKRIGSKLRFSYDNTGLLCLDSTCFATGDGIEYLVAVLNSIMGNYLLKESPKTGTGDLIISVQALEPIRIPKLQEHDQEPYKELLALILERIAQGKDCEDLEYKLNSLVFDAYGLSVEERQYVIDFATEAFR